MKTPGKGSPDGAVAIEAPRASKFVADIWSVFEIKLLILLRSWYWYLLNALVFPGIMFYWSRALAPDDPDAIRRMMTGSIVFGVALMTSNSLASQMINDRFQNRLKLLIAMPMSKSSYAWGVILFASLISAVTVALLLIFAAAAGVDFQITWTFFLIVVPAVLSMAGLTLFIASYAPSAEVGQIMATLLGIALVMISPVFFPIERAPLIMQWFGWVSPFRYAADGLMKSFSGRTDIWGEFTIIVAFAIVTMALGLWRMRWRES